jgi:hypothetical protein
MNMKTTLFPLTISIILLIVSSCSIEESAIPDNPNVDLVCGTKNPLTDLSWLSDKLKIVLTGSPHEEKTNGVVLFEYNGKSVIEIQSYLSSSLNMHQYYCDGTKLDFGSLTTYKEYEKYLSTRKKVKVLYGTEIWKFTK